MSILCKSLQVFGTREEAIPQILTDTGDPKSPPLFSTNSQDIYPLYFRGCRRPSKIDYEV